MDRTQLHVLATTSLALAVAADLEVALRVLLAGMHVATGADSGGICLLEDAADPKGSRRLYRWRGGDCYEWLPSPHQVDSPTLEDNGVCSRLTVPLRKGDRTIGMLRATARHPDAFRDDHLLLLQILADHAAAAVERSLAQEESQARFRRLQVVERISAAVNADGDLDDLLQRVLVAATELVPIQRAQIGLVDPDRRQIRGRLGINLPPGLVEATVRPLFPGPDPAEDVFALVTRTGEQLVTDGTHPALHAPTETRFGLSGMHRVFTPIAHAGAVIGVLSVYMLRPPTAEDRGTLRLVAEQVGGAIARARLADAERLARARAEQEHARLQAVIEASHDAIFLKDVAGRYLLINSAGARRVRRAPRDIIGRTDPELGPPSFWEPALTSDGQLLASGAPVSTTHSIVVDGVRRVLFAVKAPLRDATGAIIGIVGVSRDITEQTQLAAERDAAVANKARAEGAMRTGRAIAHELANPLTTILGLLTLLGTLTELPPAIADDLSMIEAEAERAAELLRRFGRIIRYEETSTPMGPQLDVHKASEPPADWDRP